MPHFKTFENPLNTTNSDIVVNTTSSTWLFDYNIGLYGSNFRPPSFGEPPKPLKFIVGNYPAIDALFITHSDSIGPLFLKNIKIYLTRPVYEQILLKYEEYKSIIVTYNEIELEAKEDESIISEEVNSDSSIKYRHAEMEGSILDKPVKMKMGLNDGIKKRKMSLNRNSNHRIVDLNDADINNFKKNVVFIKYNQIIPFDGYFIQSKPCGAYIGWCYYVIKFPNEQSISIVTSFSLKRRFSTECFTINSDFLILNRKIKSLSYHSIEDLSKLFKNISKSNKPLLVPTQFQTFFIEILFHVLSIVEPIGIPVTVISPIFNKLDILLNVQSEWLNKDFFTVSEPFPIRKYSKFSLLNSFQQIKSTKSIVFCSFEHFDLNRNLTEEFDILLINSPNERIQTIANLSDTACSSETNSENLPGLGNSDNIQQVYEFSIKIESSDDELLQNFNGKLVNEISFFIEGDIPRDYVLMNSNLSVVNSSMVVSGKLINSDFDSPSFIERILKDEKVPLKKYLQEETPIFCEGWFYLINNKIKFRIIDNSIEYGDI